VVRAVIGNLKVCTSCEQVCNTPLLCSDEEEIRRVKKRIELNDAGAFHKLAGWYFHGRHGLSQDYGKAFELFNRGAELGSVSLLIPYLPRYIIMVMESRGMKKNLFVTSCLQLWEEAKLQGTCLVTRSIMTII